jgi:hypothetical protein
MLAGRAGQRRWSGTRPIRGLALVGVLGMAAEDIRVRDRPERRTTSGSGPIPTLARTPARHSRLSLS